MKVTQITSHNIQFISKKELLNMHNRTHQLYGMAKKRKLDPEFFDRIKEKHSILVLEMHKRKINHQSDLE